MAAKNTPEIFWSQTVEDGLCVLWTGSVGATGYGQVRWDRKNVKAHRLAFFLRMGRWPDGFMRHLCHRPLCVLHVVEGTHTENMRDMVEAGRHTNQQKTHCPQGHPYDEANTRWYDGRRYCRGCESIRSQGRRKRAA